MSVNLESAARLNALKQGIEATTGESYPDLTGGVNALIAGFGQGGSGDTETLIAIIGRTAESIEDDVLLNIGDRVFQEYKNLKNARFTKLKKIGANTFYNCANLVAFAALELEELGKYAFQNCPELKVCEISKVTSIGIAAFEQCALETIVIPRCSKIEARTFQYCSVLTTIVLGGDAVVPLGALSSLNGTPFAVGGTGGTVYVPAALIESYKTATNWVTLYEAGTCNFVAIEGSEYE